MKQMICSLSLVLLFATHAKCQTLALNTPADMQELIPYAPFSFAAYHPHHDHPGTLVLVSGCTIPVGVVLALYGVLTEVGAVNAHNETTDEGVWERGNREIFAGCAIAVAGIGGCIIGAIHDRKKRGGGYGRYSVVAPKNKTLGLAYNF